MNKYQTFKIIQIAPSIAVSTITVLVLLFFTFFFLSQFSVSALTFAKTSFDLQNLYVGKLVPKNKEEVALMKEEIRDLPEDERFGLMLFLDDNSEIVISQTRYKKLKPYFDKYDFILYQNHPYHVIFAPTFLFLLAFFMIIILFFLICFGLLFAMLNMFGYIKPLFRINEIDLQKIILFMDQKTIDSIKERMQSNPNFYCHSFMFLEIAIADILKKAEHYLTIKMQNIKKNLTQNHNDRLISNLKYLNSH